MADDRYEVFGRLELSIHLDAPREWTQKACERHLSHGNFTRARCDECVAQERCGTRPRTSFAAAITFKDAESASQAVQSLGKSLETWFAEREKLLKQEDT